MMAIRIYASLIGFTVSVTVVIIFFLLLFPLLDKGWISNQSGYYIVLWTITPIAMIISGFASECILFMKGKQGKKYQINWATNQVYYYFLLALLDIEGHGIPWKTMSASLIPIFIANYCGSILARISFIKFTLFARLK